MTHEVPGHDAEPVVAVVRWEGQLAGSYYIKPNFVGRAAHIANAGYFVTPGLRGRGMPLACHGQCRYTNPTSMRAMPAKTRSTEPA